MQFKGLNAVLDKAKDLLTRQDPWAIANSIEVLRVGLKKQVNT